MAATGTGVCATGFSPILRSNIFPAEVKPKLSVFASVTNRAVESVTFTEQEQEQEQKQRQRAPTVWDNGTFENKKSTEKKREDESQSGGLSVRDYLELSRELIARSDGGPPRWFSPLECGARLKDSPLLLYLPGQNLSLFFPFSLPEDLSSFFHFFPLLLCIR